MDNQINQQFSGQNNSNNNPQFNSQNQFNNQPNPQPNPQVNPQPDNEMSLESLEKKYSQMNPKMNQQVNPQMYQQGYQQEYQQGYQQPYTQVPQKKGWDNKYFIYIGGAVAAVLILFTLYNMKESQTPSTDPTIGASTTEYASEDTSTINPAVFTQEEEDVDETVTSEAREDATESTDDESLEQRDPSELTKTTPYEIPEYNGDTFVSHSLGITFNKPSDYRFLSEDELAKDDEAAEGDFYQVLKEDIDSNKYRTEMFAEPDSSSNDVGYVTVSVVRNLGLKILRYSGKSDDEIIDEFCKIETEKIEEDEQGYIDNLDKVSNVDITITKGEFCGKPCIVKNIAIGFNNGGSAHNKMIIMVKDEFLGNISVLNFSEADCDKKIANFSSVE